GDTGDAERTEPLGGAKRADEDGRARNEPSLEGGPDARPRAAVRRSNVCTMLGPVPSTKAAATRRGRVPAPEGSSTLHPPSSAAISMTFASSSWSTTAKKKPAAAMARDVSDFDALRAPGWQRRAWIASSSLASESRVRGRGSADTKLEPCATVLPQSSSIS